MINKVDVTALPVPRHLDVEALAVHQGVDGVRDVPHVGEGDAVDGLNHVGCMREGFLLVISGPSGVGKGTVCNELLKEEKNIRFSISATTRKKREQETDGENYYFLDNEKFKDMIENGEFLEYAKVHGNFYKTPKNFVYESIKRGEVVLLEIDVQGALQVKENYKDGVFVFLLPPDMNELRNRIEKRATEDKDTIELRLNNAKTELN